MSSATTVLVVGAGAIGGFYGSILHRAGAEVSVVARSDIAVLKEHGYRIQSPLGDLSFRPAAVHAAVEEAQAPDYLVVALKVIDGIDRVGIIRAAVGPNTTIVLIENGIGIEQEIAEAFPDNPLVSCLAFVAVSRTAPGVLDHKAFGALTLGDYPKGVGEEAKRLSELLEAGGVTARLSEEIVGERWRKCIWNTPINPASVLAGGADTTTLMTTPGGEELLRGLMQEVCAVAEAEGYPLPEKAIEVNIESTRKMPAYLNSMALDYLNDRPMEVEPILGYVVRAGERHGVPVPKLATMYSLLRLLIANKADGK
jgi:2-dehydropantoate 2-reductase